MFNPQMELLLTVLVAVAGDTHSDGQPAASWADAQAAMAVCGEIEEDLELAISAQDMDELRSILEQWLCGKRHLLEHDRDVLKRAMKAYRKSLKVTVLAAESTLGGGPMSGGRKSTIIGVRPPDRYPSSVWKELVRQGRLLDADHGIYELPPG
ncbi:MAG: hypothetical protein OSB42_04025 [Planctomycetota bacterium]|nr:hypothetical protein [Planctomycetota bacterium]